MLMGDAIMRVWVVKCNHYIDGGCVKLESSRIDSVWLTRESAVEYLDEMTSTTENEFNEWYEELKPRLEDGRYSFNTYSIDEMEVRE